MEENGICSDSDRSQEPKSDKVFVLIKVFLPLPYCKLTGNICLQFAFLFILHNYCFLKQPHGSVILFTYRLSRLCIWKSYRYSIRVCSSLSQTGVWCSLQYDLLCLVGLFSPNENWCNYFGNPAMSFYSLYSDVQ